MSDSIRDVSEALFDFLHQEMVMHLLETSIQKEHAYFKLERIGFRVGQGLVEKYAKDIPAVIEPLDVMKFICKDFWVNIYKKQVDNLRTNHRGVFVIQDNKFRPFVSVSNGTQYMEEMAPFLAMPCGLIRGALSGLGLEATVHADIKTLPSCTFQIKVPFDEGQ